MPQVQNHEPELTFRSVTKDNWADLEVFFESKGGPHYCWRRAWRVITLELA